MYILTYLYILADICSFCILRSVEYYLRTTTTLHEIFIEGYYITSTLFYKVQNLSCNIIYNLTSICTGMCLEHIYTQ